MKKVLLTAALAVFGFSAMQAQEISFGAKAGLNMANVVGDIDDSEMRLSFHVGGVMELSIAQDFMFAPELLYSSQGYKFSESGSEGGIDYDIEEVWKLDYINLPLMFKYYVADGFSLEAGPQVGFLIAANADYEENASGGGVSISESESYDISDFVSSIDYGLNLGLGYKLESGLFFQARYNVGLANINDDDDSDDFKIQNSVIQVSAGFMF